MSKVISVAAIQMEIEPLNIEANLAKAEDLLKQALAVQPLDLVVFPEDCITGPIPYNLDYVLDKDSKGVEGFKDMARQYGVYIVGGSYIEKRGDNYYNTSLLIDRNGRVILQYDKNRLWTPERRYLTGGNELPVAQTDIGNIGLTICWDLAFPQIYQALAKKGADIICCPSYWVYEDAGPLRKKYSQDAEITMVDSLCPARAIENEVLLIYANGAGKADIYKNGERISDTQIGHSQICVPVYGTVEKIKNNSEGFIIYNHNKQLSQDAEGQYQLRQDMLEA